MLAQLVEQRTFNPFVVGSTPAHPTKYALWALKSLLSEKMAGFFIFGVVSDQPALRLRRSPFDAAPWPCELKVRGRKTFE